MFQLFIVIIAIALTSVLVLISVAYVNPETKLIQEKAGSVQSDLLSLQEVYSLVTATSADESTPAVQPVADGGFESQFLPFLKFKPKFIAGYDVSYKKMGAAANIYSELNYFCVFPSASTTSLATKVLNKVVAELPVGQAVLTSDCNNPFAGYTGSEPPSLVYFVRYLPKS